MRKLFWDDPYLSKTKAVITKIKGNDVCFDQSIIYSFSGGQESDTATIQDIQVLDSRILTNNDILYTLEFVPNFNIGDEIELKIDWDKRYKIMKLHSATHVALAAFYDLVGIQEIIGANVTSEKGRIDFLYPEPISTLIPEIQKKLDLVIKEDRDIITRYDEDSNNPEGRIWLIEELSDFWKIPCGGIHPKRTLEIGSIKVKRENIGMGKERLQLVLL